MFQYAAGLALARRRRTGVRLDLHFYESGGDGGVYKRPFELPLFDVGPFEISRGALSLWDRARSKAAERAAPLSRPLGVYIERALGFDPAVLKLPDRAMLVGYFQSADYFADAEDAVRAAFQVKDRALAEAVSGQVTALRRGDRPLVSLHVRRGDYLAVRPDGGLLVSLDRVRGAMSAFPDADFLVFSDDLPWCTQNIGGAGITMSPFTSAIEDLIAMSMCDHHIIANSSFSWWGAWLNESNQKHVLAPKDWFGTSESPSHMYSAYWRLY